jgi:hypothetical protein
MITERDILILHALAQYFVLNRQQIQRLIFPEDRQGRITRRRLQLLVDNHYINRQNMLYCYPGVSPAPVYYPSQKGCDFLAEHLDDERIRLTPTQTPIHHHILHWLAISETHIALNQAVAVQADAALEGWINEWDVVNKEETQPEKRFRLYTLLRDNPRLICAPDAAFLLAMQGHRKVFYLEQDRGTSGVQQVASSKSPGYAAMISQSRHRRHFPTTTLEGFSVLMITMNPKHRDNLRRAFQAQPGHELWRFAAVQDVTPAKLLYEPIFYACGDHEPKPLVKRI